MFDHEATVAEFLSCPGCGVAVDVGGHTRVVQMELTNRKPAVRCVISDGAGRTFHRCAEEPAQLEVAR
jgi:hypothetical protein